MIAKGKAIAHGTNAIRYVMREGKLDRLLGSNLIESRTPDEIVSEFKMMAQGHERCKNKYLRFEIGIAPADEERVRGSLWELAVLFAQEMKLAPMNRLFAQGYEPYAHSPDRKPDRHRRLGL